MQAVGNMKSKNNKLVGKEYLVPIVITLLFISPAFFVDNGSKFWYFIISSLTGLGLGRNLIFWLKTENRNQKTEKKFLSNFAIGIYIYIYIFVAFFIDYNLIKENFILPFLLKNIFIGCIWFFYSGLKGIQTKQLWQRGFPLTKKASVIYGILMVIFSLIILFARPLISI